MSARVSLVHAMGRAAAKRPAEMRVAGQRVAAIVLGGLALAAAAARADDFWLVPNAFNVGPRSTVVVRGQTSSRFPTSKAAVAIDRIADARLISKGRSEAVANFGTDGNSLILRHRPRRAGQYVVAVSLKPRALRESVPGFLRYLELEGATEARARLEREGVLAARDSVTRRYAKYAKTLVQVGRGGPRAFGAIAGHPLELVPARDPATLRSGDTLRVRLLFQGKPLPNAHLSANAVVHSQDIGGEPVSVAPDTALVTDGSGAVLLRIGAAGVWNVRGVHIAPAAAGSGADWDTHWVSIVFHVTR